MASIIKICLLVCVLFVSSSLASAKPRTGAGLAASPGCENAQEKLISVKGVGVHYLEAGTGQTVVLVHGNAGSADDYSYRTIELLCREYRVVAVDRPGHGKSDRLTRDAARLESQAAMLHATLISLGIKRPILVGHSWGASLVLAYALNYQDDIASLILLAPAAYSEKEERSWWMTSLVKPPVIGDVSLAMGKVLFGKRMLKKELEDAFYPQPVPPDYLKTANASWLDRRHLKSYLEDESTLNANLKTLSRRYPEIHVPVIIVTGDSDKVCPAQENAYRLNAAISHSQLIELKHTGHEIPQTDPQSIRTAVAIVSTSTAFNGVH